MIPLQSELLPYTGGKIKTQGQKTTLQSYSGTLLQRIQEVSV